MLFSVVLEFPMVTWKVWVLGPFQPCGTDSRKKKEKEGLKYVPTTCRNPKPPSPFSHVAQKFLFVRWTCILASRKFGGCHLEVEAFIQRSAKPLMIAAIGQC